jgi:hypothetical protein
MAEEKIPVDMSRIQRPYTRGPQTRKNLEEEFAREFPGEQIAATGEARHDTMERMLRELATKRKVGKDKE